MKIKDIVNRDIVNLTNCEQEPIHIPGSIQPHGFLLGINVHSTAIDFCSGNIHEFLSHTHADVLGKNLEQVFGNGIAEDIHAYMSDIVSSSAPLPLQLAGKPFLCTIHRSDDIYILEAEPLMDDDSRLPDIYEQTRQFLAYLEHTVSLKELCESIAIRTREITGYDRVMIYRFDEEYNGEIFAESKREDLEPFLGLHYPHTDIPVQARELYMKNLLRLISDINYIPVPLYTIDNGTEKNLDLGLSVLRSVSPIHVQYLQNMGVGATLTISLIHKGRLWGLIACHHYSAKNIPYHTRIVARLQGHFITSQIDVREANEEYDIAKRTAEALESIRSATHGNAFADIVRNPLLFDICNANGACIMVNDVLYKGGETPGEEEIRILIDRLSEATNKSSMHSSQLSAMFPEAKDMCKSAAGIVYHSLSILNKDCIIWFRPESLTEVHWAGDPQKAIVKDEKGLHPRKSFELWKQVVQCKARKWLQPELNAAASYAYDLQKHVTLQMVAQEEERYRKLSEKLKEYNDELENLNWISTHDLQEPLRKIQLMASRIMAFEQEAIPERMHDMVRRINDAAMRMQMLLKDILNYTKIKYTEEILTDVALDEVLNDVIAGLADVINDKDAKVEKGVLPKVKGVPFLLKQLFSNLLSNSLKFSSNDRAQVITIHAEIVNSDVNGEVKPFHHIIVSDTGIGFEKKFEESIFKIFSRLHPVAEYQGSGVGLALCKKIMQFHNGIINATGELGSGAAFHLYFPVSE